MYRNRPSAATAIANPSNDWNGKYECNRSSASFYLLFLSFALSLIFFFLPVPTWHPGYLAITPSPLLSAPGIPASESLSQFSLTIISLVSLFHFNFVTLLVTPDRGFLRDHKNFQGAEIHITIHITYQDTWNIQRQEKIFIYKRNKSSIRWKSMKIRTRMKIRSWLSRVNNLR